MDNLKPLVENTIGTVSSQNFNYFEFVPKSNGTWKLTKTATINENGMTTKGYSCGAKQVDPIAKIGSIKIKSNEYAYSGKTVKPSVTIKDVNGKVLTKGTDYTVTYSKGCKAVGKYYVNVSFEGKYSGKKSLAFKVVPKIPKIKKLTAAKKSLKITMASKVSKAAGSKYEIVYRIKGTSK